MMATLKGIGPTYQSLQLGSVTFYQFEVPENLPNLFGVQKLAIHDFAGGTRTVQQLGAFPYPDISWSGIFFQGDTQSGTSSAIQRASQLNTFRTLAQPQLLQWGPFQMQVIVSEFEVIGKLAQELEYRIKVVPIQDMTTTSNIPATPANTTKLLFDANTGVTNAATTVYAPLLPAILLGAAAAITQAVTAAIIQANGSAQGITSETQAMLQGQITALQTSLQPYVNGSDYGAATAAINLSNSLNTLSVALMPSNYAIPIATITVTNPNLPMLASQYYGDDTLWPLIAQQNNLQDMFPIGTFTLVIPSTSIQSSLIPTS
jgi:hypothetical protein